MRAAVASAGTLRHLLSADIEESPMPRGTRALCGALVDIEITRYTQRSIREMQLCERCLDSWVKYLTSVDSLFEGKVRKKIAVMPKRPLVRLAIKPLAVLAGAFASRRRKRLRKRL